MRKLIILLTILISLSCLGYFGYKWYTDRQAEKDFTSLMTGDVSLEELHEKNKDCIGIIRIKGTKINYPVMQTSKDNDEYYLRRNFDKKYSVAGTPFLSAWSKLGESDNYLIFGHNIKSGTMFHDLTKYKKKSFWQEHKYAEFENIKTGKHNYRIFAAFETETYSFNYPGYGYMKGEKYFNRYVDICKNLSLYNTKITPKYKGKLLTLSTCAYHADGGRMVIVGEKID